MSIRNLVLLMAGCCFALTAQQQCTLNSAAGTWSWTISGSSVQTMGPAAGQTLPIVGIQILSIDRNGKMWGPGTVVSGGAVFEYSLAGSIEITADCTGVMRYTCQLPGLGAVSYIERFILDPNRQEIVNMSIASQASKPMWVGTAKRLSPVPQQQLAWPAVVLPAP
jgi:hypothetical protein